jgi:hypothetical protein
MAKEIGTVLALKVFWSQNEQPLQVAAPQGGVVSFPLGAFLWPELAAHH